MNQDRFVCLETRENSATPQSDTSKDFMGLEMLLLKAGVSFIPKQIFQVQLPRTE
jgi:hypothetical protein